MNSYPSIDYRYFNPIGYPHITAIIPNIDIAESFDVEMSQNWLRFLDNYFEKIEDRDNIINKNNILIKEITDLSLTNENLSNQIDQENITISQIKSEINQLNIDISNLKTQNTFAEADVPYNYYGRLPKNYTFENDIFRSVYERNFENISNSIPNENVSNTYLHNQMANALRRVNNVLNNPSQHFVPQIAQEIMDANLTPITLNSASRSVLHQASLTSSTRASYLNSLHALGVAVDLKFKETNYDTRSSDSPSEEAVNNYNKLLFVLKYCGLVRSTKMSNVKERNHFSLSTFSKYENGQLNSGYSNTEYLNLATKMFSEFEKIANDNLTATLTSIDMFTSNQNQLISQTAKLSSEIETKSNTLKSLKIETEQLSKSKRQKQVAKQKIIEKKEREERARRDREDAREHLREMRERRQREREVERERERRQRENDRRDRERDRRNRERDRNPPRDIDFGGLG